MNAGMLASPPPMRLLLARVRAYYRLHGLQATIRKVLSLTLTRPGGRNRDSRRDYHPSTESGTVRYIQPPLPRDFLQRCGSPAPRALVVGSGRSAVGVAAPVVSMRHARKHLELGLVDVLFVDGLEHGAHLHELLKRAHACHVPCIYIVRSGTDLARQHVVLQPGAKPPRTWSAEDDRRVRRQQAMRLCTMATRPEREGAHEACARIRWIAQDPGSLQQYELLQQICRHALQTYRTLQRPLVSIVTILYNKAAELPAVLVSYERQTYAGDIEVVFVDDASTDDSVQAVECHFRQRAAHSADRSLSARLVKNPSNFGNCHSRNRGIVEARGDLLIIVDADCMLSRDFVHRHVEAHAFDDCEVVIGPMNIETGGAAPLDVLDHYEAHPNKALQDAKLQDASNPASFLNCVTRNFSIKRNALAEPPFDPDFSYSADPESGFGWEDIEMGYRLYALGARIKFVEDAFSVHVSSKEYGPDPRQGARSMRNFARLFDKHPDLALVAPRWSQETYRRLWAWTDIKDPRVRSDSERLAQVLPPAARSPGRQRVRRYRVVSYRWHVPHQYELFKLPMDVSLLTGLGSPMTETWDYGQRPLPGNARFKRHEEADLREFDFAILHFDENVLAPENTNGTIGPEWGRAFKYFVEHADLPKIAVCHGTAQFRGQYDPDYDKPDLMQIMENERQRLVDYLGDIPVVCNSYQAAREWGFRRSRVIWHGFDPAEFPPATYEKGIVSPLGPLVLSRPHYRGYFLYREVFDGYYDELKPETLRVLEPHVAYEANAYARAKYRNYVDELRRYSVYFNPTLRSPMPRARGEPMMCGVVPVSARNHDVDMFIQNGINGFYGDSAAELREQLRFLLHRPDEARRIGANARRTAMKLFHHDRFQADWRELIQDTLG